MGIAGSPELLACKSTSSLASPQDTHRHLKLIITSQTVLYPLVILAISVNSNSIILVLQAKIMASSLTLLFVTPHTIPLKISSVQNPIQWLRTPSVGWFPSFLPLLLFLKYMRHTMVSGPLLLLFPLPRMFFLQISTWLAFSFPLGLPQMSPSRFA